MAEPAEHADKKARVEDDANGEPVAKPARAPFNMIAGENGAKPGSAIDLLRNYAGGRTVVERAATDAAPSLDWDRFGPQLGVSPKSDGSGPFFLPREEASPVAPLLTELHSLKGTDRNSIIFTSNLVVTVVGEVQRVISECGYDWSPQMQQKLGTTLNSSANVKYALRYALMAFNHLVQEVLLYLAPGIAPLDILATAESTKRGAFCDSYDQIGLLHELALIFSRFPTEMQKPGGLGAVHRELQRLRESPPPPTSAASLSSVGTTPSATIAAPKPSSSTVAVLPSALDAPMEPLRPPPPLVPPTSSSLDATQSSQELVAPRSSLTNNVKPTSDTAASSKAPPSEGALADLRRRLASRENKNNSLDATAMDVDLSNSAPDAQALAELLENYSFDVPEGSEALTKDDVKKGDIFCRVSRGPMALCRVSKVSGSRVSVTDSTNRSLSVSPGHLRRACSGDVATFPPEDGPWTVEPLLATPLPPISLPPDDIITKVVDGTRQLLSARDVRITHFNDTERRLLQIPVETLSDALDRLPIVLFTLDGTLSAIDGDRARMLDRNSLRKVNSEVHSLVLLGAARELLQEWAKTPEHMRPPLASAPVAQASVDVITEPRKRKTTELFANDPNVQKSSYGGDREFHAKDAVRTTTELSCAGCGAAFVFSGGEKRYTCTEDDCKKIFCSQCAGYGCATTQKADSKWKCPTCKSASPIDMVSVKQTSGSLIHGSEIRLLTAGRIRLALGDDYVEYCKDMGSKFGSQVWYELEVLTGAYERVAACRRFTKSTVGSSNICIDRFGNGIFAVYDDFWDQCREPGETPLQVAERMTIEVQPGFVVIAGLFQWGVLDYLDGAKGGFVGGERMKRLRDVHGVYSYMPTVADFLALPYQECPERLDEPEWPTPELKDMFCEYGAEEARRLAISGPDVPPARQPAQGPGSRNHALETPAVIVADREERGVRERATLKFLLAFKAGRLHDPALQVMDGLHEISGWLSIDCEDCSLGPDQHIKQQTPLYLAAVRVRERMGEYETRGPFIKSPLRHFLNTGVGDGSDLARLRGHWNVFMGAAWRARYRETPTSEYKYVELQSTWEKHDPVARAAGPEALPAPDARAPRSKK